jgi:predicted nucleic acid-binding protein
MAQDPVWSAHAERRRRHHTVARRALTLVIDASIAVPACLSDAGFSILTDDDLVAPPLLWSETRSVLHEHVWRKEITRSDGEAAVRALDSAPVRRYDERNVGAEAWRIADELGWAKTYDAEYVALAHLLGCRLVTLDGRLRRGAERLGLVVTIDELQA